MRMRRRRFEALVEAALDSLPPEIEQFMSNVEVVVEDWPTPEELAEGDVPPGETLFGLYHGVPLTERTSGSYSMVLPDRIVIYQGPLEDWCQTTHELVEEVRKTVIHEVAHHFGISDERLAELGWD